MNRTTTPGQIIWSQRASLQEMISPEAPHRLSEAYTVAVASIDPFTLSVSCDSVETMVTYEIVERVVHPGYSSSILWRCNLDQVQRSGGGS